MSVHVTVKMPGNVDVFTKSLGERAEDFVRISTAGKAAGAIHHRFAVGPDYVVVIDEWDTAEHFEAFFSDPELQAFIGEVGGDTSGPPEIIVGEVIGSPDHF